MKRKSLYITLLIAALLSFTLACGAFGGKDEPTATPAPTQVEETEEVAEPTAKPTNTPKPTATEEPALDGPVVPLGETYRSAEGGYSFDVIQGYSLEEFFGFVSMEAPDADPDLGPAMLLIGGLDEESATAQELFDDFRSELEDDIEVSEPRAVSVGGVEGLEADITGEDDEKSLTGKIVIAVPEPKQRFTAFGSAPSERWDGEFGPLFDSVVASVAFFEPEIAEEPLEGEELRQWAWSASASSEYGDPGWSADQATGEPDTGECGDFDTAWASADPDTQEWLELEYVYAVVPTAVNVVQTYSPNQVTLVELIDADGIAYEIYSGEPEALDECPFTLSIAVEGLDVEVSTVRITVDQSVLGVWNEIDAVELVGLTTMDLGEIDPGDGDEGDGDDVIVDFPPPEGFLWRAGGESGASDGYYASLGGMDTSDDGLLYVTDNIHGILVFDEEGNEVAIIDHDELNNPTDVQVGPDGNLYVASWGVNQVFVFSPEGELLLNFGSEGQGDGEFGTFSPSALAVSPAGEIFVLDENEDAEGEDIDRVQVFSGEGAYLRQFVIEEDFFAATAMDFGPDGDLYVLGFIGAYLLRYDTDGTLLGRVGEEALDFSGPQSVRFDDAGNLYVSTWTPSGVMKLDPDGNQVATWGVEVELSENPWPEGGFVQPTGVAVLPDGSMVFASDTTGNHSFVTAFEFK